jgi:asparagine synthase (glutamine-hydrolysing)
MSTADGRYWIVYNGEIYNFPELRVELQASGIKFASNTDTEVVLAAYAQWGTHCLHRFNGMWAFAIVDTVERSIYLARDRFGVKPLYWWRDGNVFLFASEIKAFLAHPSFSARPNRQYLERYLWNGAEEYPEETAFEGVFRLRNARFIQATVDQLVAGSFQTQQWEI